MISVRTRFCWYWVLAWFCLASCRWKLKYRFASWLISSTHSINKRRFFSKTDLKNKVNHQSPDSLYSFFMCKNSFKYNGNSYTGKMGSFISKQPQRASRNEIWFLYASNRYCMIHVQSLHKLTFHINGLVQERRNSSVLAMELRLSCTKPSIYAWASQNIMAWSVFKTSAGPRTLPSKIWVSPASFPSLSYINFGKIVLQSCKFQILFWRLLERPTLP